MALSLSPVNGRLPKAKIFAVLAAIILLSEIASFEIVMVLPALPPMAAHFETLNIAWVISIVTLAGATISPLFGKAADKWGKKRVIVIFALIHVAGSVIAAVATTLPILLVGRAMQGAMVGIVAIAYSLVRDIIPRDFVPIALGTVVTGIGMSAIAGPFLAGWIVDSVGFAGIFWFLALYVVVLLPFFIAVVPESPVRIDRPVDYLGTALLGPGIALVLVALTKASSWGWLSPPTLLLAGLGIGMLGAFVAWQRVAPNPLIDLQVLLGPKFGLTILAVACVSYMMNAQAYISPILLQTPAGIPGISYGAGLSVLQYALWAWPLGVVAMATGPLGGYLSKRIGARQVLIISVLAFLLVMFLGSRLFTLQWQIMIMAAIGGVANGFLHSSNANLVQDALPSSLGGVGNSIGGITVLLSASIATTATSVVMSNNVLMVDPVTHGVVYADTALVHGYLVAGLVGIAGLLIALTMKHGRKPALGGLTDTADDPAALDSGDGRIPAPAATP